MMHWNLDKVLMLLITPSLTYLTNRVIDFCNYKYIFYTITVVKMQVCYGFISNADM